MDFIRALVAAWPQGASLSSAYIGCPLWTAYHIDRLTERGLEIIQIMVDADNDGIRTIPDEGWMVSLLGSVSEGYSNLLSTAAEMPASESMQSVLCARHFALKMSFKSICLSDFSHCL